MGLRRLLKGARFLSDEKANELTRRRFIIEDFIVRGRQLPSAAAERAHADGGAQDEGNAARAADELR